MFFTAYGIMHRRCCLQAGDMDVVGRHQPAPSPVHYTTSCKNTQSSAPEDGRNYRPKHVELIEIVNKLSLLPSSWLFI